MRQIRFRARISQGLKNAGQWVYWGIGGTDMLDAIDPDTIGQLTGIMDKHGKAIYEGDVLLSEQAHQECHGKCRFTVFWDDSVNGWSFLPSVIVSYEMEIAGNIHENPELLSTRTGE